MKLFTKYSRVNLLAMISIFVLSSVAFYFVIRLILIDQVDDDLGIEQREIETYVKEHNVLPESIPVKDQEITYSLSGDRLQKSSFETIAETPGKKKQKEPYRILRFGLSATGKFYTVTVSKSLESTDQLSRSILLISSATILLILGASFILNRLLLKRLWQPFYDSLAVIKNFRVDKTKSLNFPPTQIDEFSLMNQTLEEATGQAQKEYILLKEFTENASHEMQTPLAIMRSKLDLLIQDENLSESQSQSVQSAYAAIEKLSKLNRSLLLLAKIENNQYAETTSINLREKLGEKLEAFHELWQNQNIVVSSSLHDATVDLNSELVDILLNNLLSNATRHNSPNGFIRVVLERTKLEISNSSLEKELNAGQMFQRFFNQHKPSRHNGLGLSIVKQICDVSGCNLQYSFTPGQHSFIISWHEANSKLLQN